MSYRLLCEFLHAHAKIEHLAIDYQNVLNTHTAPTINHADVHEVFTPATLPRLRTFRGSSQSFYALVKAKLRSLTRLRRLNLGSSHTHPEEQAAFGSLVQELQSSPIRLGGLKALSIQLSLNALDVTDHLGRLCGGTVEDWFGHLPHTIDESVSTKAVAVFKPVTTLRVIHFCYDSAWFLGGLSR